MRFGHGPVAGPVIAETSGDRWPADRSSAHEDLCAVVAFLDLRLASGEQRWPSPLWNPTSYTADVLGERDIGLHGGHGQDVTRPAPFRSTRGRYVRSHSCKRETSALRGGILNVVVDDAGLGGGT